MQLINTDKDYAKIPILAKKSDESLAETTINFKLSVLYNICT